jgi:hypothetical protein
MDEASTKLKLKRQNKGGMGNLADPYPLEPSWGPSRIPSSR